MAAQTPARRRLSRELGPSHRRGAAAERRAGWDGNQQRTADLLRRRLLARQRLALRRKIPLGVAEAQATSGPASSTAAAAAITGTIRVRLGLSPFDIPGALHYPAAAAWLRPASSRSAARSLISTAVQARRVSGPAAPSEFEHHRRRGSPPHRRETESPVATETLLCSDRQILSARRIAPPDSWRRVRTDDRRPRHRASRPRWAVRCAG